MIGGLPSSTSSADTVSSESLLVRVIVEEGGGSCLVAITPLAEAPVGIGKVGERD